MNPENNKSTGSVLPLALLRLALLVIPEIIAVNFLAHNGLVCFLVCLGILVAWLSVDVGPFRAVSAARKPALAKPSEVKAPRLAKVQSVSYLFCKAVLFAAMFQSRMTHWH